MAKTPIPEKREGRAWNERGLPEPMEPRVASAAEMHARGMAPVSPEAMVPLHLPERTAVNTGETSPMDRRHSPRNTAPGQKPY